jgi:hypothetical protein
MLDAEGEINISLSDHSVVILCFCREKKKCVNTDVQNLAHQYIEEILEVLMKKGMMNVPQVGGDLMPVQIVDSMRGECRTRKEVLLALKLTGIGMTEIIKIIGDLMIPG